MSLNLYVDGVVIDPTLIKWDAATSTATTSEAISTSATVSFLWDEYGSVKFDLSAEDYAVIEEVIIESIVRGHLTGVRK